MAPEGVINPPLGFELKAVDREAAVADVKSRSFAEGTVERFGLAVSLGGRFKCWLVIPIHDRELRRWGHVRAVLLAEGQAPNEMTAGELGPGTVGC